MDVKKPSDENSKYPRAIIFIIGAEFCERFSYYGMRAILVLYLKNVLFYSDDSATEYYHMFAMASFFFPVFGAIIADTFLGRFKTIFYISILYAIGNLVLSLASLYGSRTITWVGLVCIALGTGGIKPCVAAFGGDQFLPGQEALLAKYFSFFYIAINAGSLVSTAITPVLREDVHCFGRDDCFPLAFGVPAVLMISAVVFFIIGKYLTNYVIIPPLRQNIVLKILVLSFTALSRKLFKGGPKKDHWLDYADDKCDAKTFGEIKLVMRILFLYLPLPLFWALFEQQGSRWTLQATRMDGNLFGIYRLKPDQMQIVNPLLIIAMIPVFEYGIYPLFGKMNILTKPLQRMTTGGILAAIAFLTCSGIQFLMEADLPPVLQPHSAHITVINGLSVEIKISDLVLTKSQQQNLGKYDIHTFENVNMKDWKPDSTIKVKLDQQFGDCKAQEYTAHYNGTIKDGAIIFITDSICVENSTTIQKYDFPNVLQKPEKCGSYVGLVFNIRNYDYEKGNASFWFKNKQFSQILKPSNISYGSIGQTSFASTGLLAYKEMEIHDDGQYELNFLTDGSDTTKSMTPIAKNLPFKTGGSYLIVVSGDSETKLDHKVHQLVKPNTVSMFWLILQYFIITCGEIMFSITGIEFSYAQAPKTMKSVLQAAWLMTISFGNLIVAIIATAKIFERQSFEFIFFAAIMLLDMIVFALMANSYVPFKEEKGPQETPEDQNANKQEPNAPQSHNQQVSDQKEDKKNSKVH